jgi:hypothetical protein
MRSIGILWLVSCAPRVSPPEPPADVRWRLVQHDYVERRVGDATLRPGSMIYLAPEPGRSDVLAVDPIPTHFEAGETVTVRVMIRPSAEAARYEVQIVERSPHLQVRPENFELSRGEWTRILMTASSPGPAQIRLEAVPKGGVQ